jgi:basic membrane protein A
LINNCNADIILPVAGNAGKGSLYAAKDNKKWGIGVDTDQYYSLPEVGNILLTSCTKSLETTVYSVAKTYLQNPVLQQVHLPEYFQMKELQWLLS